VFYFAVPLGFPLDIIPPKCGILISNGDVCKLMRGLSGCDRIPQAVLSRA
jgi:hypothetical protein